MNRSQRRTRASRSTVSPSTWSASKRSCEVAAPVFLDGSARARIAAARAEIERAIESGEAIYGVNTGFGNLANVGSAATTSRRLQERLVLSHAAGVGEPLAEEEVRGMLLLRANTLARGHSGVREVVVERLLELLVAGVHPVVPSRGSVGASGDLAPLAHLALAMSSAGARRGSAASAVGRTSRWRGPGLAPLRLAAREGLGLINGTQAMTALLALAALDARGWCRIADLVGALSTEALRGADTAFDPRIHAVRPLRRTARRGGEPLAADAGIGDPRIAPPGGRPRPGSLLDPLHAAGARGGARRPRRRRGQARGRDECGDRQSAGVRARRRDAVGRQLPRRADGDGRRLPGDRHRRARLDLRAAHREAHQRGRSRACRPSWSRTRG